MFSRLHLAPCLSIASPHRLFHASLAISHKNPLGLPPALNGNEPGPGLGHNVSKDQDKLREEMLKARMMRGLPQKQPITGVKHVITVASGKGGVGKSTVAGALLVDWKAQKCGKQTPGSTVGLLDADLFGPSVPRLLSLQGKKAELSKRDLLLPLKNFGISCMSMGFLIDEDAPVVWRGLMVMKALEQLLRQVDWQGLDVLVIDMPPGTGDTQLTISQQVPISGAVIVSTPQEIALMDARKGINMFTKVDVPILGLVQNMAYFTCKCGEKTYLFGKDGVRKTAEKYGVPLLGELPLEITVQETSDEGRPIVVSNPDTAASKAFKGIAQAVLAKLNEPLKPKAPQTPKANDS